MGCNYPDGRERKISASKTNQQKAVLQAEYTIADKDGKESVRRDYRKWVDERAKKAEGAAQNFESKELYKITTILSNRRWIKIAQ